MRFSQWFPPELSQFAMIVVVLVAFLTFRHWAETTYPPVWLHVMEISALLNVVIHPWKWVPESVARWLTWVNRASVLVFIASIVVPLVGMAWGQIAETPAIRVLAVAYQVVSIMGWAVGLLLLWRLVRAVERQTDQRRDK